MYFWFRLAIYKEKYTEETDRPVSIVIASRNEEENLKDNLIYFLEQDYPNYEVIVANDRSWDNSIDVLRDFSTRFPHLKTVEVQDQNSFYTGKKWALFLAIKSAKHPNILLTDADCKPATPNWIKEVAPRLSFGKEICLSHGAYEKRGGLLNWFIRFDTFITAQNYFSFALAKKTYMGVGRNLAYTKDLFMSKKGFLSNMRHPSGDDDLFINEAATSKNVAICLTKESFTISTAKQSWKDWFIQKFRHLSTGKYYKGSSKFWLGIQSLSTLLFLGSALFLLHEVFWYPEFSKSSIERSLSFVSNAETIKALVDYIFPFLASTLGFVLLLRYILIIINGNKLGALSEALLSPILEPIHSLFRIIWALVARISKKVYW